MTGTERNTGFDGSALEGDTVPFPATITQEVASLKRVAQVIVGRATDAGHQRRCARGKIRQPS